MKRFTETTKWEDSWYSNLPIKSKIAWEYITCKCDNSGVWDFNPRIANACIGDNLDWDKVLQDLKKNVAVLSNGKWLITSFVDFQFGSLSENSPLHKSIISTIKKNGIKHEKYNPSGTLFLGLPNHNDTPELPPRHGKGMVKEEVKEEVKAKITNQMVEDIYNAYPKKIAKEDALKAIRKVLCSNKITFDSLLKKVKDFANSRKAEDAQFTPYPATWFNGGRYLDDPSQWKGKNTLNKPQDNSTVKEISKEEYLKDLEKYRTPIKTTQTTIEDPFL